ncbi:unnamed protein product [Closterium sp. NIES-65]|nr:unnamed protein product [Closterium sp. NIES-65]
MFAGCRILERIAEHPLFINAVCAIRDVGTGYVPPKRGFIGGAGLRLCCENIDRGLAGVKASWKRTGVTIASDMMTDKNRRQHANVFLVNDSVAVFKDRVDCRMETKTGGYVASILRPVVEEVDSENVGWAVGERKKATEKFALQALDTAGWRTAEFFCKLMKLSFMAMRKADGDAKGMMVLMYDIKLQLTEDVGTVVVEDEEQLSYSDKVHIRRLLKSRWDGSLACPMHVTGRILNPANQDEDIFGSDAECTKVFKVFITQHPEHLSYHEKEGGDGNDLGEVLMELQDGVRAFLDMKGSFGMGDAIA